MSGHEADVVVVGAGGDGPVTAWRLGRAGLDVLVLEAGPWHGNEAWPDPHEEPGAPAACGDPEALSGELLDEQFTKRELDMGPIFGKFRWGPADRSRTRWPRLPPDGGDILQVAGVGGTTLHYLGNHPRALPAAVDDQPHWPISYEELLPYYRENERRLDVAPAPTTAKEAVFYEGAAAAGWDLLDAKNVTRPGYRPQPNAIRSPDPKLRGEYEGDFRYPDVEGSTLAGHDMNGTPHPLGAPYEEKAKRSTNVSYVPLALETGNVRVRPNAFVTNVHTDTVLGTPQATGVTFRDTWRGTTHEVAADVVVLAAGAVESPRLWKNADLPPDEAVGQGLTIHWPDVVVGVWDDDELEARIGQPHLDPHVGMDSGARFDYPGLGSVQIAGIGPGFTSLVDYGASKAGFAFQNDVPGDAPWDTRGRIVGEQYKRLMTDYRNTLTLLVSTDDWPHRGNAVSTAPAEDEHGPIPNISYEPSETDDAKRDELSGLAANILRAGGANHVHRADVPPVPLHIHSTMRMGAVTDEACEARAVDRLFVADHSALPNSLGGPNPTNTGQALAMRTADRIVERYFD